MTDRLRAMASPGHRLTARDCAVIAAAAALIDEQRSDIERGLVHWRGHALELIELRERLAVLRPVVAMALGMIDGGDDVLAEIAYGPTIAQSGRGK